MNNYIIIAIFVILSAGLIFIFFYLQKYLDIINNKIKDNKDEQSFLMLQNQLQEILKANQKLNISNEKLKADLTENLNKKMSESQNILHKSLENQFSESKKIIQDVTKGLEEVKAGSKQVISFTEQLKNLQDILQNSKQRGALGEYFLEQTIENILSPENYQFQYSFKDGTIVDAIIKLPDGIVPIDAKFSLENYNKLINENDKQKRSELENKFKRDLLTRIQETAKYIKPREGTMDFAFMFIPSEGIYYDLLISRYGSVESRNFLEYAFRDKKVIVVSPTTLHAYLQTIMQGLKNLKIEKKATEIQKNVENLQKHINSYSNYHKKLGKTISTVVNHYDASSRALKQISNDTKKIVGDGEIIEVEKLNKPKEDE